MMKNLLNRSAQKSPGDYYQEKSSHRTHPPRENTHDLIETFALPASVLQVVAL